MNLTPLLKRISTTLLAAVFAYRQAVASSLSDLRSSILSVTEAIDDLYDVAAVSSFYGSKAWLSWLFVLLFCLLSRCFEHDNFVNKRAHIFGLDLNLISACAYPLIAAGNLLSNIEPIWRNNVSLEKVTIIVAPLMVLRLFYATDALLLIAWLYVKGLRSTFFFRVATCFTVLVLPVWVVFDINSSLRFPTERFFYRRILNFIIVNLWAFSKIFLTGLLLLLLRYTRGFQDKVLPIFCVGISWTAAFVIQSIVDSRYWFIVWSEHPSENGLFPGGKKYSELHAVFSLSQAELNDALDNGDQLINVTQTYVFNIHQARDEATKFEGGNIWPFTERNLWLLWLLQANPLKFTIYLRDLALTYTLGFVILIALSMGLVIVSLLYHDFVKPLQPLLRVHSALKTRNIYLSVILLSTSLWGVIFWFNPVMVVLDFLTRWVVAIARPGLFMPVTHVRWIDLNQMVALILNGVLSLLFSLLEIGPRIRELLTVVWIKVSSRWR